MLVQEWGFRTLEVMIMMPDEVVDELFSDVDTNSLYSY